MVAHCATLTHKEGLIHHHYTCKSKQTRHFLSPKTPLLLCHISVPPLGHPIPFSISLRRYYSSV